MRCLGEEALSAWIDGEATAEEAAHVRACPACGAEAARLRELGSRLRTLPLAREAAPAALAASLERLAAPRRPARRRGQALVAFARRWRLPLAGVPAAAAVAAAFVLALGGGVSPALAAEAAAVHAAGGGSCEWTGAPDQVARELSAVLGHDVELPLPPDGELIGARPCTLFGERAVAVSYRTRGEEVTLLLPTAGGLAAEACNRRGRSCREVDGQTVCVVPDPAGRPRIVVGALPADQLCDTVGGAS